jgi:hypothetical protein
MYFMSTHPQIEQQITKPLRGGNREQEKELAPNVVAVLYKRETISSLVDVQ